MSVRSNSWQLSLAGRLCRLFPPGVSGVFLRCRPRAQSRDAAFEVTARSSLAPFRCRFTRGDWVTTSFAIRGFFDLGVAVVANAVCRPGDTIVEVGANVGTETLLFASVVGPTGRVVCFEPLPENVLILREQVELNGFQHVSLHAVAVSDRPGALRFIPPAGDMNFGEGRVAGAQRPTGGPAAEEIEVPAVTLDGLRDSGELPAPRLITIDVQGVELLVLRGAERLIRDMRPYILLEIEQRWMSEHGISPNDLFKFFDRFSYGVYEIAKWGLREVVPGLVRDANWLCLPQGITPAGLAEAKRISGRIRRAQLFPLIRGLNPAVVARR